LARPGQLGTEDCRLARLVMHCARTARYFFAGVSGEVTLASRRNRADSSGGVGLM
jgi:hypothetical protein